ncbi:MAG TPA: M90 family metallopeptidase [Kofleriaceae bacterium]|nr:M90 family metallopeptidase [Kofleriaceae bacterium]
MFGWLTERRRARLLEQPFPLDWEGYLDERVAIWQKLDEPMRQRLRDLTLVFVDEKHWEGSGGLELTDEMKVTIGAHACVLLLGREHALYQDVESILVYPTTMVSPRRPRSFFEVGAVPVDEGGTAILGEAHLGGPVILAWDSVVAGGRAGAVRNVVFHELAHKIDMLDGAVDGTPPLDSTAARRQWAEVCSHAFLELRERVEAGQRSFLDDYGATHEAEFFAVATEAYFLQPKKLRRHEPALHALLAGFYRIEL